MGWGGRVGLFIYFFFFLPSFLKAKRHPWGPLWEPIVKPEEKNKTKQTIKQIKNKKHKQNKQTNKLLFSATHPRTRLSTECPPPHNAKNFEKVREIWCNHLEHLLVILLGLGKTIIQTSSAASPSNDESAKSTGTKRWSIATSSTPTSSKSQSVHSHFVQSHHVQLYLKYIEFFLCQKLCNIQDEECAYMVWQLLPSIHCSLPLTYIGLLK